MENTECIFGRYGWLSIFLAGSDNRDFLLGLWPTGQICGTELSIQIRWGSVADMIK